MAVARLGIKWLDLLAQLLPRNQFINFQENLFTAHGLAKTFKIPSGEGLLFHLDPSVVNTARFIPDVET